MVMPPIPPGINALSSKVIQSVRTDMPPDLERGIVDGGVREGRPENPSAPGMATAILLIIIALVAVALFLRWRVYGFP